MMERTFSDRTEAGRMLAEAMQGYADRTDLLVLALPRGGVPVAFEVAKALHAPLDLMLVRKLGVPGHEELAMGAIAIGGGRVLNERVVRELGLSDEIIKATVRREQTELQRRSQTYRGDRPPPEVRGRCAILVDDGLATGATMLAAVRAVRQSEPAFVVVAVPVAPSETCFRLREEADDVICLNTPANFFGVGQWYENFSQTTDDEVYALLKQASEQLPAPDRTSDMRAR